MTQHKNIIANGCDVYYVIRGKGPALMLLHGFPLDHNIWQGIVDEICDHYTVILPDLPGAGKSTLPDDLSIETMAAAMGDILKQEGIDKAVLCGHSMGGYVALAFAELYPDRIAGLGMIHSTAHSDSDEKKEQREKVIKIISDGGKEPFINQMITALYSDDTATDANLSYTRDIAMSTNEAALLAFYKSMINRPDRTSTLQGAAYPCLWIVGDDDKVLNKNVVLQQSWLANVNYVYVLKNCGHISMIETPKTSVTYIKDFLVYCYDKETVRD